ncbi:2-succinyl-5-enolpyruvyl-6-hydroxy-3-cyclohexene-1-carboxylic-acid synthase [Nigerium massiliense]|uniref:2-succinyl-5-enolpyruvyl-6-hydroxy-3- cyclohexene-1-carboxylic-acid synthase n=1 Tax=Nigerium massiliense TaxID=1522317 RepID=UPI000590C1A4|nr:2-succinyl-5-enolpyruvyl-6-hydroxy-3-cyclohexene-1-carboxylic-acid synthase [Nigerium massiliense]
MTGPDDLGRGPASIDPPTPCGSGAVEEAEAIWRALAALGVRDVVLAPGSRSAPFVYALQDATVAAALRPHVRVDERAAAFTALGISRANPASPGVVVTTSGTATAHLHAAVLEAHHAGVPLIVLTADRPAELRDTGANQATRQAGLYGDAVRYAFDLPAPAAGGAAAVELRTAVNAVARAFAAATGEDPGPVHLNVCLRDPLTPVAASLDAAPAGGPIVLTRRPAQPAPEPVEIRVTGRTVVVAGDGAGPAARAFAEEHRLPLFAEPSSDARGGDALIGGYPELLREVMTAGAGALRPDRAVVFGHPTLSRPVVTGLLGAPDVDVVVVHPGPRWPDAARRAGLVVPAAAGVATPAAAQGQRAFLAAWRAAASAAPGPASWQARAAVTAWDACGPDDVLVLGSSSVVRDLEQHAGAARATVVANRGLAGIDGLVSTATGVALARAGRPGRVRALIGDLTAVHDLTGLVIGPDEPAVGLDVVVLDDGGGRIFSGLEHRAAPPAVLRRFFTTPHGVDLVAAGRALGVPAAAVTPGGLAAALAAPATGRRLLVVREGSAG